MKTWILDPQNVAVVPGNENETLDYAAAHFVNACKEAIEKRGAAFVALSGGSTPKAIFQRMNTQGVDGKKVFLFWSDERTVPPTSPDSNYKMAIDSGPFQSWIPEDQIFRMEGEKEPKEAAIHYEKIIRTIVPEAILDLVTLGMGDDGHTASLFPNTVALNETFRLVTENFVPKLHTNRITFTFPLIQRARETVVYLIGRKKAEMAKTVLIDRPGLYPAERIGTMDHPAKWILDNDAARLLESAC